LLQSTYTQLKQDFEELSESKDKVVEGGKQDDTLIVDKTKELSALEDDKDALLKRLEALSKSKKCSPKATNSEEPKNETINASANWDAGIQQLLNEAYENNKRDTNPTP
jgi:flagellar biosynthesis/type III secretory pathway chaperone